MDKFANLWAPPEYWALTPEQKAEFCNGCGGKGFCGYLVPDTIWGLSITEACNIHDYMYEMGETLAAKEEADRVFRNNMLRTIEAAGGPWLLQRLRARRAQVYYEWVRDYGAPYFWWGKNRPEELKLVAVGGRA